ncbi:double-strand break repair protein AddB, partial [Salipiger sp. HF18]|uniref:PD-(D/E)XK nuclease family protein n=1 Tax=Salipiger sp. HF18 TaxID=2721557 RepID=UPI00158C0D52
VAEWFAETERARQQIARPVHFEQMGRGDIPALGFTLRGKADRIDMDERGNAHLYDYKTGAAPSEKEQLLFDKQLLLEAAMVERGAFKELQPRHTERAVFVSLAPGKPREVPAPLAEAPAQQVWAEFETLMTRWFEPDRGYTARAALLKESDSSDYDHLSRFGEWDVTDPAKRKVLS